VRAWASIPYEALSESSLFFTLSALLIGGVSSLEWSGPWRALFVTQAAALISIVAIGCLNARALSPALTLMPLAALTSWLAIVIRRRTPVGFLGVLRGSRAWRAVWAVSSLLAVVQMARLSTYVSNPESDWFVTTDNPFFAKHECANAYVYAAELNERGERDVYDPIHYPGLNPDAEPQTQMVGMAPEDPFQYPPPFLMLPQLAMSMTHDYAAIRSVWYALNVTLCLGTVLLLSLWVGRSTRWRSLLLAPLMAVAFPVLHNFQYGQFHFAAVALAVLGMLALETRRRTLGGALLASAISAKVFPVFLLVPLLSQKRFADVTRVAIFGLFFAGLGWMTLGPSPYAAFFELHLPRLSSGAAFAFGEAWPEVADLLIAGNQGIPGMVTKVQNLGVNFLGDGAASAINHLYVLLLLPLFWVSARAAADMSSQEKAAFWIGVLGLASLASAGAWADYVPLSGVWALIFLIPEFAHRPVLRAILLACGFLQISLVGTVPLGPFASASWMFPLSLLSGLSLLFILTLAASAPIPTRSRRQSGDNQTRPLAEVMPAFPEPEVR
jgi:hypothetical protein